MTERNFRGADHGLDAEPVSDGQLAPALPLVLLHGGVSRTERLVRCDRTVWRRTRVVVRLRDESWRLWSPPRIWGRDLGLT